MATVRYPRRPVPRERNAVIGAIHAAASKLGLDEEARRAMQAEISGQFGPAQTSCARMTDRQLAAVLAHLNRAGDKNGGRGFDVFADRPRNLGEKPMLRKIAALLTEGRKPWNYAHALGKKLGGGERLEFCTDDVLRKVISALAIDLKRHTNPNPRNPK